MSARGRKNRQLKALEAKAQCEERRGWLTKKGKWALGESWKRRWFELKNDRLTYYVSEGEQPKGSILLKLVTDVSVCLQSECKKEYSFKVISPNRTYWIFADTAENMREWVSVLQGRVRYHAMRRDLSQSVYADAFASANPAAKFEEERKRRQETADTVYNEYLARAKDMPLQHIEKLKLIESAGKDNDGIPVFVFPARALPAGVDLEDLLLYMIKTMDPVVKAGSYSLIYMHSNLRQNTPQFSWIRKSLGVLQRNYKKNLKSLYLVHPTIWVKAVFKFLKPFISSKFWRKLVYIEYLEDLYSYVPKSQLSFLQSQVANWENQRGITKPVFGAHLDELLNRPGQPSEVPTVVTDCIAYLDEKGIDQEGIYRLSGSRMRVNEYKERYDAGQTVDMSNELDPNNVASLLKLYFRELPEPLLTFEYYDNFVEAMQNPDAKNRERAVRALLYSLPPSNFLVLSVLLKHLNRISKMSKVNKMNTANLATVFGPNILRAPSANNMASLMDAPMISACVSMLIEQCDSFFKAVGHTMATEDNEDERAFSRAFSMHVSQRISTAPSPEQAAGINQMFAAEADQPPSIRSKASNATEGSDSKRRRNGGAGGSSRGGSSGSRRRREASNGSRRKRSPRRGNSHGSRGGSPSKPRP